MVNGFSDYDAYLAKLDTAGTIIWYKNYGGAYRQRGLMVKETYDEGFIIGGWNEITGTAISSFYLVRTTRYGDTVWTKSYPNGMQQYGQAVAQTTDSGFVICGSVQHPTTIGTNSYVIRTNANGDTLWTLLLNSLGRGAAYDVKALPNNHIILTGYTFSACALPYLCELDENGTVVWQQTYTSAPCAWAYSIVRTTDNGYAIFGMDNTADYYLIKTDSLGNQQWFKTYNEGNSDYGYCVRQTSDGGYVMTGTTAMGAQFIDISLIKTDGQGNVITSVTDMTDEYEVVAYPNPAGNYISLIAPERFRNKPLTLKIYNTLGQQQILKDNYHSSDHIFLTDLAAGLYHISVSCQEIL